MSSPIYRCSPLIMLVSLIVSPCRADEGPTPIAVVEWAKLKEAGTLQSGEVVPGENGQPDRLKIVRTEAGIQQIPLCEIASPAIKSPSYAVRGRIRYEKVVGEGFLEMWNHFPDGGQYFSRTKDISGPMGIVTGTSPERDFILPFHTLGKAPAPKKLVLNLVLAGPGTVEIGPLELVPIPDMANMSGAWWSGPTGGIIGGIGGTLLGLLGALVGTLVGLGKAKKLVAGLGVLMGGLGLVTLVIGISAVFSGQPYEVYYPLILLGVMMIVAGFIVLVIAPARFRDLELRRMQALDVT